MTRFILIYLTALSLNAQSAHLELKPMFSSLKAEEFIVEFKFFFRTDWKTLNQARGLSAKQKLEYKNQYILSTLKYLYGPLNSRSFGNPQRDFDVVVDWNNANLQDGFVMLPYTYSARWIIFQDLTGYKKIRIPVPFTASALESPNWQFCTDPEHQNLEMYWYYWDPARPGCDQKDGREFQYIVMTLTKKTENLKESFPEYERLILKNGAQKNLNLTFAFGYAEEVENPLPDQDHDFGIRQYQSFVSSVRQQWGPSLKETLVYQKEFPGTQNPNKVMGHRFQGIKSGVLIKIDILAAADVDQMEIFSKSFAHDHDSFFGWFGHSRLGWGFDSDNLVHNLRRRSDYFSISPQYQMIYWAGCNTYSYYTLPFFQMKTSSLDPFGTKGLDIISNGLPSYFALNSSNARVILNHLMNWELRTSYQAIIQELESAASDLGAERVLINVLGDEDNAF